MKNLYTFILALGLLTTVNAQFTLSPKTAIFSGPNNAAKTAYSTFTNTATNGSDSFEWMMIESTIPAAWVTSFCDPKDCYASVAMFSPYWFIIPKGNNGIFKGDVEFQGVSGTGYVKFYVYNKSNPSISDTLTYAFSSWNTGIRELNRSKEMVFFPNPVKDQLNLKYASKESVTIEIYNILGSRVKSFIHDAGSSTVNVSDLQNGVYFIRFRDGNTVYSRSFTKAE